MKYEYMKFHHMDEHRICELMRYIYWYIYYSYPWYISMTYGYTCIWARMYILIYYSKAIMYVKTRYLRQDSPLQHNHIHRTVPSKCNFLNSMQLMWNSILLAGLQKLPEKQLVYFEVFGTYFFLVCPKEKFYLKNDNFGW